ncbi:MAG: hypothetical protein GX594_18670 [Pirellulaceae bacterium]|nr:hypothetical protein [Pirellulaceae bacterium]
MKIAVAEWSEHRWMPGVLLLCGSLYFGSLVSPCLMQSSESGFYGYALLFLGWLPLLFLDPCSLPWLANPLLAITLIAWIFDYPRLSIVSGISCSMLAMSTFLIPGVWFSEAGQSPVGYYGSGFFMWLASCCLPAACMIVFATLAWFYNRAD